MIPNLIFLLVGFVLGKWGQTVDKINKVGDNIKALVADEHVQFLEDNVFKEKFEKAKDLDEIL